MFSKLGLLFLVVPSIRALTLNTPTGLTSGGSATITWTNAAGDPSTFSLELVNVAFNNAFAISNNVDPSTSTITLSIPVVPAGSGYTLEAVDISNINNVFATSGSFSIGDTATTTTSSSTSATSSSSSASGKSTVATTATPTTTGFGTTATPTKPASTSSGSSSSSSSSSTSTSTGTKSGAVKFGLAASNVGAVALAFLAVAGGAALVL